MENVDVFSEEYQKRLLDGDDVTPSMYINDVSKIFNTTVAITTERVDVSHGYRRILFHLAHHDGLTQLQLTKFTHLTAPTVSVSLSKMERDGLVRREADENDMRQVRVFLTKKGREHHDFIINMCKNTEERMLRDVSIEEQQELCRIMRKILRNLLGN